jgi:hypothetical protein
LNFQHPAKNRAAAIIMCVAPGPRALIIDWLDAAPLGQLADASSPSSASAGKTIRL